MTHITEEWKPVVGFEEQYQVSNQGNVLRAWTVSGKYSGKLLRPGVKKHGYCHVTLSANGIPFDRKVHVLVMAAFVGERPPGMVINHIDTNKQNNTLGNLEYVTQKQNIAHSQRLGRYGNGEVSPNAKLTNSAVYDIRRQKGEVSPKLLAEKHGVSVSTVYLVQAGKIWKHLP